VRFGLGNLNGSGSSCPIALILSSNTLMREKPCVR
jgi:hypothetical protein